MPFGVAFEDLRLTSQLATRGDHAGMKNLFRSRHGVAIC